MAGFMKRGIVGGLIFLLIVGVMVFGGCGKATPAETPSPAPAETPSSAPKHPSALKPLISLVGEEGLSVMNLTGYRAAALAMERLGFDRGDEGVLLITDAGNPVIGTGEGYPSRYYTTEGAVDGASATSGCTAGSGNLIIVNRSIYDPLWFAFFSKKAKKCIYLEASGDVLGKWLEREAKGEDITDEFLKVSSDKLFSKISVVGLDPDLLITEKGARAWDVNFKEKTLGGNEFSIVTICSVWAKGMRYDFIKAAELHNHICPGLTSGIFIIRYLAEHYPPGEGEYYAVWAIPPWCKDDAFQAVFDSTVGKRRMAVMYLPKDIQKKLKPEYQNIAGIYIKFNKKTGEARAIVLGFDWNKLCKDCGISRKDFRDFKTYKWWWVRLRSDVLMMDHSPDEYVSTLKEADLGKPGSIKKLMGEWMKVGANPLSRLGLMAE